MMEIHLSGNQKIPLPLALGCEQYNDDDRVLPGSTAPHSARSLAKAFFDNRWVIS